MSDGYPMWANVIKDFLFPLLGFCLVIFGARYVLRTNRDDRRNQLREQQNLHTYTRCHGAINAVFVILWGKDVWTLQMGYEFWLKGVWGPITADLTPHVLFFDDKLDAAWKQLLKDGEFVIKKAVLRVETDKKIIDQATIDSRNADIYAQVGKTGGFTDGDLKLWERCAGEFLMVVKKELELINSAALEIG